MTLVKSHDNKSVIANLGALAGPSDTTFYYRPYLYGTPNRTTIWGRKRLGWIKALRLDRLFRN